MHKHWEVAREFDIFIPNINHIDLFEPNPSVGSGLKILNGRLHGKWMQDLPFEPNTELTFEQMEEARRRARSLGFDYLSSGDLLTLPQEQRLERLETLVAKGLVTDPTARAAVLGTAAPCGIKLSSLFDEYQGVTGHEIKDLSPDQLRIWRNSRTRAVERFVALVGDKPLSELTHNDAIDYSEWWRDRLTSDGIAVKTANKDIGQLSRMLKEINIRRRLNLPDIFKGLHLRGETDKSAFRWHGPLRRLRLSIPPVLLRISHTAANAHRRRVQ
jgi:hypothetical protein